MGKTSNTRRVGANEARAKLVNVRISPQKLNLVAQSIRGLPVQKALNELEFSRKRIAPTSARSCTRLSPTPRTTTTSTSTRLSSPRRRSASRSP